MPVEFVSWDRRFPLHKKAYNYLRIACRRSRLSSVTVEDVIESKNSVYIVTDTEDVIGCFTLAIRGFTYDRHLELPLLAGKNLKLWRDDLVEFILYTAKNNDCNKFTMIGRKGFERLFPELKLLCCVYGKDLI